MIVVTTPNGNIGKHVLRRLIEAGESVRAVSHRPERIPADLRERCEIVPGFLNDADALTHGFAGANAVFWCVPQSNEWEDGDAYYGAFTNAAVRALAANGSTARVVAVGGGGYGAQNAGFMSLLTRAEDGLNAAGVSARHLRCGYFMENLFWFLETIKAQGAIYQPFAADVPIPWVAARDIAAVAVRCLRDTTWDGQSAIPVVGAADVTMNEAATILSDVLGKPVRYHQASDAQTEAVLLGIGSAPGFIGSYLEYARAVSGGAFALDARTADGTTATTLREWAASNLLPALGGSGNGAGRFQSAAAYAAVISK